MENIANRIKRFRKLKNMSQEDLANASGINISTIKKYECGNRNPKPDQVQKIADALGISISALLPREITSINDIMTTIIELEQHSGMTITAEKDENGEYIPETVSLKFGEKEINKAITDYLRLIENEYGDYIVIEKYCYDRYTKDRLLMYICSQDLSSLK